MGNLATYYTGYVRLLGHRPTILVFKNGISCRAFALLGALMMAIGPQPKRSLISILTWLMLCQSIDLVILTLDCVCLASRTGTLSSGEVKLPAQHQPVKYI